MSAFDRFMDKIYDYADLISVLLLVLSISSTILGGATAYKDALPTTGPLGFLSYLKPATQMIGNWYLWLVFLGPLGIIIFGYLTVDYYLMKKKFEELINTDSKAQFIKNYKELEELAWKLTTWHRMRLTKKKVEFNIR